MGEGGWRRDGGEGRGRGTRLDKTKLKNNLNMNDDSTFDYGFSKLNTKFKIPSNNEIFIQDYCYKEDYVKSAFTEIGKETLIFANKNNSCVDENGKKNKLALFWDSAHPTTYAHCWISYAFERQLNEDGLIQTNLENMNDYKKYCLNKVNESF